MSDHSNLTANPTDETVVCPHCNGIGRIALSAFKVGDRVLWKTNSWWGDKPAGVIAVTKKRVRIKTDPHTDHNGGRPWIAYVSPHKLERING